MMFRLCLSLIGLGCLLVATGLLAGQAAPEEAVLRLEPPKTDVAPPLPMRLLRPRIPLQFERFEPSPAPTLSLEQRQIGPVAKLRQVKAQGSPLALSVGTARDVTEVGQAIDRAIIGGLQTAAIRSDREPRTAFLGLSYDQAWGMEKRWDIHVSAGVNVHDEPDHSRFVSDHQSLDQDHVLNAHTTLNLRLRYQF